MSDMESPKIDGLAANADSHTTVTTGRSQRVRRQPKKYEDEIIYGVPGTAKSTDRWIDNQPSTVTQRTTSPKKSPAASRKSSTTSEPHSQPSKEPKTQIKQNVKAKTPKQSQGKGNAETSSAKLDKPVILNQDVVPNDDEEDDEGQLQIDLSPTLKRHQQPNGLPTEEASDPDNVSPSIKVTLTADNIDQILAEDDAIFSMDLADEIEATNDKERINKDTQHDSSDGDKEGEEDEDSEDEQRPDPGEDVSDYSPEQDDLSDYDGNEDPNKPWCICRRPQDQRFMIGCDSCGDWYHDDCVNITQDAASQLKEWICPSCVTGIKDGKSRDQLKAELLERQKQEERECHRLRNSLKLTIITKDKRRKSSESQKTTSKSPQVNNKKSESDADLLRSLIQKKKQDFATRTSLSTDKSKQDDTRKGPSERDIKRHAKYASSSQVTSNKPLSICLHCDKELTAEQSNNRSRYCNEECLKSLVSIQLEEVIKARKYKSKLLGPPDRYDPKKTGVILLDRYTKKYLTRKDGFTVLNALEFILANPSYEMLVSTHKEKGDKNLAENEEDSIKSTARNPPLTKLKIKTVKDEPNIESRKTYREKERKPSRLEDGPRKDLREVVRKGLRDIFFERIRMATDIKMSDDEVLKLCCSIEDELFKYFSKDANNPKYKTKYRSLLYNLKDVKNQGLWRKVITGSLAPVKLVSMDAQELAGEELAKWREKELKHSIEAIKREQQNANEKRPIIKMTHKGEEEVNSAMTEPKELESLLPVKREDDSTLQDSHKPQTNHDLKSIAPSTPVPISLIDSILGPAKKDTTAQHKQHLFDQNCRICMKKSASTTAASGTMQSRLDRRESQNSTTSQDGHVSQSKVPSNNSVVRAEPKRVRVETDAESRILKEAERLTREKIVVPDTSILPTLNLPQQKSVTQPPLSSHANVNCEQPRTFWSGLIEMTDVTKFEANAYHISGDMDFLKSGAVPRRVHIRGRIAPEQVIDYTKKLRRDTTTKNEILIVRFVPASNTHRQAYEQYFEYLNGRNRYGVVGNIPKSVKDFYVFPLPRERDIPSAFRPFNGPGIEERKHRPNLLLGLIVRKSDKKRPRGDSPSHTPTHQPPDYHPTDKVSLAKRARHGGSADGANTPPPRSLTPPRFSASFAASMEEPYDPEMSLTPPQDAEPINPFLFPNPPSRVHQPASVPTSIPLASNGIVENATNDDEAYDPEKEFPIEVKQPHSKDAAVLQEEKNDTEMQSLMSLIGRSSDPGELINEALLLMVRSRNLALQKRLIDALDEKVAEQRLLVEDRIREAEAAFAVAAGSSASSANSDAIPGLGGEENDNSCEPEKGTLKEIQARLARIEWHQARLQLLTTTTSELSGPPLLCEARAGENGEMSHSQPVDMEIDDEEDVAAAASGTRISDDELVLRARQHMAALAGNSST